MARRDGVFPQRSPEFRQFMRTLDSDATRAIGPAPREHGSWTRALAYVQSVLSSFSIDLDDKDGVARWLGAIRDTHLSQGFLNLTNQVRQLPKKPTTSEFAVETKRSKVAFRPAECRAQMTFKVTPQAQLRDMTRTARDRTTGPPVVADNTLNCNIYSAPTRGVLFHSHPLLWSTIPPRQEPHVSGQPRTRSLLLALGQQGSPDDLRPTHTARQTIRLLGFFGE